MIDSQLQPLAPWLEDAWLERYLERELNDAETAWFEAYMLDKPRLVAAIDADNTLRDGMHAWHAQQQRDPKLAGDRAASPSLAQKRPLATATWFRPFSMAAGMALAALLGASAARWMIAPPASGSKIASPTRIIFDTMRGSAADPLVEGLGGADAPLLVEIAVPIQATAVVAYFADKSSLALPVTADGFVSLNGSREQLLASSPVRITWTLDGQSQERSIDILAALAKQEG